MVATLCCRRQVVLLDGEGLAGYDTDAHRELWRFPWDTQQGINVAQPLVLDENRVFISSGYGVGCAMLKVTESRGEWSVNPLWGPRLTMRCKFTSPVAHKGFLYGLDEGILVCLDESGTRQWKGGRYGHGQLLITENLLLILSESGSLVLVEANPEAPHELGRLPVFEHKTWNSPALAGGRAFLRNDREMACYDLREQE
jgi:outer membrane protein assembly factor BamB